MFCNSVFNSLVLDNKLIKFLLYLYYKINALKSLFVEIDFNLSSTYCGVISTTAFGMLGLRKINPQAFSLRLCVNDVHQYYQCLG